MRMWIAVVALASGLGVGGGLGADSPQALAFLQNTLKVVINHTSCASDTVLVSDCDCSGEVHSALIEAELNQLDPLYGAIRTGTGPTYTVTFDYLPGCGTASIWGTKTEQGTVCADPPPFLAGIGRWIFVTDNCP